MKLNHISRPKCAFFLMIAAVAAVCFAQGNANAADPKISCAEPTYDFGTMDNNTTVEHEFTISNDGDAPLEIGKPKTSCGCTVANLKKNVLQPGEKTEISATLSLKGRQGEQQKIITVPSNDPATPNFQLHIKGTAMAIISLDPRFISYGPVKQEPLPKKTLRMASNKEGHTFNITKVAVSRDEIKSEVRTITPGKVYEIDLIGTKALPVGTQNTLITISTDDPDPTRKTMSVTASATVLGPITVHPDKITVFQTNDPTVMAKQMVLVRPGTETNFTIEEVVAPSESIGVELVPRGASTYLINLSNIPRQRELEGEELIIRTSSSKEPEIRVPFVYPNIPTAAQPVVPVVPVAPAAPVSKANSETRPPVAESGNEGV